MSDERQKTWAIRQVVRQGHERWFVVEVSATDAWRSWWNDGMVGDPPEGSFELGFRGVNGLRFHGEWEELC